ncbi:hypothetical protein B0G57_12580 [Trinickia symbiotica]|nr:hypothetical protein B0G57_12580 [Trinickia symbiotica]
MAGAAQHCVHRITQGALEPIPVELAICLHMADGRFDRAAPADHRAQAARDAAPQAGVVDLHALDLHAPIAAINNRDLWSRAAQNLRLLQSLGQRMPVVRIARHRACTQHQPLLVRGRDRHLHAELVRLARFALGQALDLRRVQRVELLFVLGLLRHNPLGAANQFFQRRAALRRHRAELPVDVAHHAPHPRAQGAQRAPHALVLLGVRVAADLAGQARRFAVVVLPQLQAVLCCCLHQMLSTTLQQTRVGWMRNRLLHHCRVDDHALDAGGLDHACALGCLDCLGQQFFHAGFAQATAPARQARRVDRRLVLQIRLAREHLPVRVLNPLPDDFLVGQVEGVLQVQQPCDQTRRGGRAATLGHEALAHHSAQPVPVDQVGQTHQRVWRQLQPPPTTTKIAALCCYRG